MEDFLLRLLNGPSLLFLGQEYLKLETGEDIFLEQVARKYNDAQDRPHSYSDILDKGAAANPNEAISWMLNRCLYVPVPKPLETISGYAWSGVYTTAFDDIIDRAFRSGWRQVQSIYDDVYRPSNPRSRQRLHITHLYGSLAAAEASGLPPLKREDLWQRHQVAVILSNRITELVTPLGTLVIEAYSLTTDWFSPERMYAVVSQLGIGQTHMFSSTPEAEADEYLRTLIDQGRLVVHRTSLAEALNSAAEQGRIQLHEAPDEIEFGHQVKVNSKRQSIPLDLWTQISSVAHVLVESFFLPLSPQSSDLRYSDFRHFLFESSYCPPWEGYARGFAFERDFESELREEVTKRLKSAQSWRNILVLSGQTGTGKTVALGHLAFLVQKEGRYPVLFIERCTPRVRKETIDRFCEWAEEKGAPATLVIWDGMEHPDEYYEMLQYLQSRGRKALLVGSCYRLPLENFRDARILFAPDELNEEEIPRFIQFLSEFDSNLVGYFDKRSTTIAPQFLAFLYRLLPPSRIAIRRGVEQELSFVESVVSSQALSKRVQSEVNTLMGELLLNAGLIESMPLISEEPREVAGEFVTEIQELIGLVMVPGQFNLTSPLELVIRATYKGFSDEFVNILRDVDVFRWTEDQSGNLRIGPRSALEAQLIVRSRIGGPRYEVDYASKLVTSIRVDRQFEQQEIDFAVDLFRSMGPNGPREQYFLPYFDRLADCLERLRAENGVENPRLMLQESMLRRESAKQYTSESDPLLLLKKAESVCRRALEILVSRPANRPFLCHLHTEMASAYGLMANQSKDLAEKLRYASLAHYEGMLAHSLDPQNLHAIDVICWTVRDLLRETGLSEEERAHLTGEAIHAFNLADLEGYIGYSLERLNARKEEIFAELGQFELSQAAFEALLQQGSCLGIYARAFRMVASLIPEQVLNEEQRTQCERAYNYIMGFKTDIKDDAKCLFLLLRVWWMWKTGKQMITDERSTLQFSDSDWNYLRNAVSHLLATEELAANLRLSYLKGLAEFHLGDYANGLQTFRELDYDSQSYGRRVIKHYLWADSNGNPRQFNGTVHFVDDRGRGEIYVTEIQRRVPFLVHDTGRTEVKKGDSFNNFRIAFSFRGPLADFK